MPSSSPAPPIADGPGSSPLNGLAFHTLAGAPRTLAELLDEIPRGETLGLGSCFISEPPDELAPVVEAYRARRPTRRFDGADPDPGR